MNINITPEDSQLFLEFCQNRVQQLENEINERTTQIKRILRLIDSVDETEEEPERQPDNSAAEETTSDVPPVIENEITSPENYAAVIDDPKEENHNKGRVSAGTKRGPYQKKAKTSDQEEKPVQNKLIKTMKKASKLKDLQEVPPKKLTHVPGQYSNRRSLYPELEREF